MAYRAGFMQSECGAPGKWAERLAAMADAAYGALLRSGRTVDESTEIVRLVLGTVTKDFGGIGFYLPKWDRVERLWRDCAIFQDAGRMSNQEIALKYSITQVRVYQIVKEQRAIRKKQFTDGNSVGG